MEILREELQVLCILDPGAQGPWAAPPLQLGSPMIQAKLVKPHPPDQCRGTGRDGTGQCGSAMSRTTGDIVAPCSSHPVTTWKLQSRCLAAGTCRRASGRKQELKTTLCSGSRCRTGGMLGFLCLFMLRCLSSQTTPLSSPIQQEWGAQAAAGHLCSDTGQCWFHANKTVPQVEQTRQLVNKWS